jgi:hypothetical protein
MGATFVLQEGRKNKTNDIWNKTINRFFTGKFPVIINRKINDK